MTDFDPEKLKHKPNEKHTLDEVLKSLQDLIHNDLLKGEAARAEEPPAPEPEPAIEETPVDAVPEETDLSAEIPEISLSAADVPLSTVVQSLEELVKNDLALSDDSVEGGRSGLLPSRGTTPSLEGAVGDELGEAPTATPLAPLATPAPATGQQAFSFDDADTRAPAEPEPIPAPLAVDEPELSAPVAESSDFDELAVELAPPPDNSTHENGGEAQEPAAEIPVDDLPVLTDAVTEAVPPMDDLPVLEEIALESPDDSRDGGGTTPRMAEVEQRMEQLPRAASGTAAGNNPSAIAARVIARLNADRRARGEAEFDDATLDALYTLLRDEIERNQSER